MELALVEMGELQGLVKYVGLKEQWPKIKPEL